MNLSACVIDDRSVQRVIDLDQAVVEIADRQRGWESAGLAVGPVSWRDEAASWPQRLEADRSRVDDADSIGVRITGLAETELCVVLYSDHRVVGPVMLLTDVQWSWIEPHNLRHPVSYSTVGI
jgi:hypothetical protein